VYVTVGLLVAASIGGGVYLTTRGNDSSSAAPKITGLVNYRTSNPGMLTRNHVTGTLTYPVSPPVGGDHNPVWQNCMGSVYDAAIATENAVHSLEHGAVPATIHSAYMYACSANTARNTGQASGTSTPRIDTANPSARLLAVPEHDS
jgi:hypothetical protein